jgi:hypothetical protein
VSRPRRHLVRPRLVWGGLAVALAGSVVVSIGIILDAALTSVIGAVVLLLGAALAVGGGALYDALPAAAIGAELHRVVEGGAHEGVVPGQMYADERAREEARAAARQTRELEQAAQVWRIDALARPAGILFLMVAAALVIAQWQLVDDSVSGRTGSSGDTLTAIALGLAGLRCVVGSGRHRLACAAALVAGAWLVAQAVLVDHGARSLAAVEVVLGALAVLGAVAALGTSDRPTDPMV